MTARPWTAVLLVGIVVTAGVGVLPNTANAQAGTPPADETYVLEQGGVCEPIEPLSTDGSVEEFYDYRSHETHSENESRNYSSYGTTDLQEDDTSHLMLHEGPDGVSLVMVHDRLEGDSAGGLATLEVDGVPSEAEWVVMDDDYGGEETESNSDEFERAPGQASASWVWREARTDGGAIRGGLDGEFALTVRPAFNDESAFADETADLIDSGEYDGGTIENWTALSGDLDDPDRTELSLEDPVTIRTGTCEDTAATYDRTGDGVTAHVENAEIGEALTLTPATGSNGVGFEELEVVPKAETVTLEFEPGSPDGVSDSPRGVDTISGLTLTGDGVASGTVTFTVEKEVLESHDLEPADVTVYGTDGTEWNASPTAVHSESGESYRFVADVSATSAISVGQDTANERTSSGESGGGDEGGSDLLDGSVLIVGIVGIVGIVVSAALLAVLWAKRGGWRE